MNDFDDIMFQTKKFIDAASNKLGGMIEASKNQIERAQLRGQLRDEYAKLGKYYYESTEKSVDRTEQIKHAMASIQKTQNALKDLEHPQSRQKTYTKPSTVYCLRCGQKNSAEFDYCSSCGTKLIK